MRLYCVKVAPGFMYTMRLFVFFCSTRPSGWSPAELPSRGCLQPVRQRTLHTCQSPLRTSATSCSAPFSSAWVRASSLLGVPVMAASPILDGSRVPIDEFASYRRYPHPRGRRRIEMLRTSAKLVRLPVPHESISLAISTTTRSRSALRWLRRVIGVAQLTLHVTLLIPHVRPMGRRVGSVALEAMLGLL